MFCNSVTSYCPENYKFNLFEHDIILRNEGIKIMNRKYLKALKKV